MKTLENKTVYKCDYCNKKLFVKHAMEKHEKYCGSNPDNDRVCSFCDHMERNTIEYYYDRYDGEHSGTSNGFYCNKLESFIYPPFIEGKPVFYKNPEQFEDQIPFRRQCEHYHAFGKHIGIEKT